jgi:uncharacterized small protein (DUF1192 family)
MNVEEFLVDNSAVENTETENPAVEEESSEFENIDVQKAVVESLAADKAKLDEEISTLRNSNEALKKKVAELEDRLAAVKSECESLRGELAKTGDILAANSETELANKVSLLDRPMELPDRFPGETREQVLEVIKEARICAEAEGRLRKAQVLEGVLVANEPTGELAEKRAALEKFFADNHNVLTGTVIAELEKCGISHKHGEEYLLPAEIIKRTY